MLLPEREVANEEERMLLACLVEVSRPREEPVVSGRLPERLH